ncbi:hypothetical protein F4815DRAFT_445836 [Daldinia loculata]|nr:hypothetical protein F4815DRAFT_445836 [Daldinia loculata]
MMNLDGIYHCSLQNNAIEVKFVPHADSPFHPQCLRITFHRTIRVPDNRKTVKLPPDLGTFPLFGIRDYAHKLPPNMVAKGGLFLSMYQREAMWIDFKADWPFMIKIYAGGVNVVSGEHAAEDSGTKDRRRLALWGTIQDYVVAPKQLWLDGIATSPGVVRQFVAMPMGQGYSVEAQLTGEDTIGGLQFEITPSAPRNVIKLFVQILHGRSFPIMCSPPYTISAIKNSIYNIEGTPPDDQYIIFGGTTRDDHETLVGCGIQPNSVVYMTPNVRGGGPNPHATPMRFCSKRFRSMSIAAGGKIDQCIEKDDQDNCCWVEHMTMTIPVQILNSAGFRSVMGRDPPPSPVSAETYAAEGLPFFDLPEEPSTIAGNFDAVKSVNEMDQSHGIATTSDASINPCLISLNERGRQITVPNRHILQVRDPNALLDPAGPLRPIRTVAELEHELYEGIPY